MTEKLKSLIDRYSARVDCETAGKILGFTPDEIRILNQKGVIKPLANPKPNCRKYYALVDVALKFDDQEWLKRATSTVYKHWRDKNLNKSDPSNE